MSKGRVAWNVVTSATDLEAKNAGLDELWTKVKERHEALAASGALLERRRDQAASWMREIFEQRLLAAFKGGKRAAHERSGHVERIRVSRWR